LLIFTAAIRDSTLAAVQASIDPAIDSIIRWTHNALIRETLTGLGSIRNLLHPWTRRSSHKVDSVRVSRNQALLRRLDRLKPLLNATRSLDRTAASPITQGAPCPLIQIKNTSNSRNQSKPSKDASQERAAIPREDLALPALARM
jgi:hypothetical protein